jgi:AGCS family alanine or glycine:cation symporter
MLELIHKIVWGPWLMALFLAAGLFYTFRSKGFQVRGVICWWRATAGSFFSSAQSTVPRREQLKTACTALAATVGTGNIVGVATAITSGGPGALFWMWISAAIGMMTAYGEVYLGMISRFQDKEGNMMCGPFVYLRDLAKKPGLAFLYGLLCLLCSLGMGSMVQANSLAETASYSFGIPKPGAAVFLGLLTAVMIRGGRQQIRQAAEKLVPISAGIYILFSVFLLFVCRQSLPAVFQEIFREAFRFRAAAGGVSGYGISLAIRYGLARGVFSNEAGLGSLAVLHGDSPGQNPKLQGMWAMFEVFFDTIVVCTLTGLVILCSLKEKGVLTGDCELTGAALTSWCFSRYFGSWGFYLVSVSLILFAFATIIAWYYLGSQALCYLMGERNKRKKKIETIYQLCYVSAVIWGCIAALGKVWMLSDILNGLMALPNITALFLLSGFVIFPEDMA